MWLCILLCKRFEDTFENAQWRKAKQVQPMWLCILSCRWSEDTFENAQWRKVEQMQPVWLCIFSGRQFEETFETHSGEKSNKCYQCDSAFSRASHLRTHFLTHSGESQINATKVTMHLPKQAIWGHTWTRTNATNKFFKSAIKWGKPLCFIISAAVGMTNRKHLSNTCTGCFIWIQGGVTLYLITERS